MLNKPLAVAVILLFFSVSVIPSTGTLMMQNETLTELIIDGPTQGNVGERLEYMVILIDPEGCTFWLFIDWDDGTASWMGPCTANEEYIISNTWYECGIYTIQVIAGCNGSEYSAELEITITSDNILYVGGSGPGNYTKIQDAIDDASDGDTVFVYNGTYYEFVLINKQITLRGEDKNNTIIEGSGTPYIAVLYVYPVGATNVKISNFTIRNTPDYSGILLYSSNNTITNCILYNLHGGIYVYSDNNSIINCQCYNNFIGISISTGNNNEISYCKCYSNEYGGITISSGKNNKISNCNIYSNIGETVSGIYMDYANNNTITKCNISINQIGIWIAESDGNIEKKNNFIGNITIGITGLDLNLIYHYFKNSQR